jgi:Ser/Thr protein kinase RdoA (MazF antagonist)
VSTECPNAHTTQEDAQWTESVIADAHDAFKVPFEPCVVMQDYHEDNLVVEHIGDEWRVSEVFDLGGAYFGDGEADICRLLATNLREEVSLAKGYLSEFLKASPTGIHTERESVGRSHRTREKGRTHE